MGALPIRNVKVAFYDGDPAAGGNRISVNEIPNIEAPNDLEPRMVTVGVNYPIKKPTDIYVMIDPDGQIEDEITTFNNVAKKRINPVTTLQQETPAPKQLHRGGRGR